MKRSMLNKVALFAALMLSMGIKLGQAQSDTVLVKIIGGQQDDRGVKLIPLSNGDVLMLSSTNSTSSGMPHAWVHRLDSTFDVVWQTTIADDPLIQPVDAVEHSNGNLSVLGLRYGGVENAYDWGGYTLDAAGNLLTEWHWGTEAWDIPTRITERNDTLWSIGKTYASGVSDVAILGHVWLENQWSLVSEAVISSSAEEDVVDALFLGNTLLVFCTINGDEHAQLFALNPPFNVVEWSYESSWEEPTQAVALDERNGRVVALMNVEMDGNSRLAFSCFDEGMQEPYLQTIPGSGFDIHAVDATWFNDSTFATVAQTNELGLGGEELLFSRWSGTTGAWQGGPSFGTAEDDEPKAMLNDESNRIWIVGASDAFSNGREDIYLLQIPNAGISGYIEEVELLIEDDVVSVPLLAESVGSRVYPNPTKGAFWIESSPAIEGWTVFNGLGIPVLSGNGTSGNLENLPSGCYWIQLNSIESKPKSDITRIVKLED
ncbi:MAG: hypothetical protein ACO2XQ_09140 [Flavobacteriales bacterium]